MDDPLIWKDHQQRTLHSLDNVLVVGPQWLASSNYIFCSWSWRRQRNIQHMSCTAFQISNSTSCLSQSSSTVQVLTQHMPVRYLLVSSSNCIFDSFLNTEQVIRYREVTWNSTPISWSSAEIMTSYNYLDTPNFNLVSCDLCCCEYI